jgi:uncharacterized SAM-binding protein YcdF (DUF218 family)
VVGAVVGFVALDLNFPSLVSFWPDASAMVPALAAATAVAWLTPLRRLAAVATALLAALWLVVSFTPLTQVLRDDLVRRDEPRTADAVFVFGSRVQVDGEPTSEAMSRLLKGLQLVSEGRAARLIVSEQPKGGRYAPIAREWTRVFAPKVEVLAVGLIRNTHEEAVAVSALCAQHGWKRVIAVSSPVHMRRAAGALEKEGLEVVAVPAVETRYDLETLDEPGDRRRAFGSILHERLGLAVYARRGWIG